jgi:hypothetical protein
MGDLVGLSIGSELISSDLKCEVFTASGGFRRLARYAFRSGAVVVIGILADAVLRLLIISWDPC